MGDAFRELQFITGSENRVAILTTLGEGAHTEEELIGATDSSKMTVRRGIEALIDRGWVRETDAGYTTTRAGSFLATEYERMIEAADIAFHVGSVREFFPLEQMDFDFNCLRDARIEVPPEFDSMREYDRVFKQVEAADHLVAIADFSAERLTETVLQEVKAGMGYECVYGPHLIDAVRESESFRATVRELLEHDVEIYRSTDPDLPTGIALYDDLVGIGGFDESGSIQAKIESRADPVVEWFNSTYETARSEATPLTADQL